MISLEEAARDHDGRSLWGMKEMQKRTKSLNLNGVLGREEGREGGREECALRDMLSWLDRLQVVVRNKDKYMHDADALYF